MNIRDDYRMKSDFILQQIGRNKQMNLTKYIPVTFIEKSKLNDLQRDLEGRKEENQLAWRKADEMEKQNAVLESDCIARVNEVVKANEEKKLLIEKAGSLLNQNINLKDELKESQKKHAQGITNMLDDLERAKQENEILSSQFIGETRLTMRSIRRVNALIGLFFFSMAVLAGIAFFAARNRG